ncbi:uncharacterized protein LOC113373147 isoform X2 [Ctenocephalides felis]|nr:uncharacterized protein LOC113373147 isoform X2 [Ctenocephalides felis]
MSTKSSDIKTSYSAALLNVAVAGSSLWALRIVDPEELYFALTAFGIVLANSLCGIFRYGHPEFMDNFKKVHAASVFVMDTFPVPLIVTELYLQEGFRPELCYLHLLSAFIPTIAYTVGMEDDDDKIQDLVIVGNLASLTHLSYITDNHWGTALGVSCILNYFGCCVFSGRSVPYLQMYYIGYCFFNYFAIRALFE